MAVFCLLSIKGRFTPKFYNEVWERQQARKKKRERDEKVKGIKLQE